MNEFQEDIQRNIERNRKKNPNAVNLTAEKAHLLQLIEDEKEANGSQAQIAEYERQLDEILQKEREKINELVTSINGCRSHVAV